MFLPNNFGIWTRLIATDKFGQPIYSPTPQKVPCGVVQLKATVKKTAIRTDAAASRANADEIVIAAIILFPASVQINEEDKFSIAGQNLRVMMVQPRFGLNGALDHYECNFEEWEA